MVGRRTFPFGMAYFQGQVFFGRVYHPESGIHEWTTISASLGDRTFGCGVRVGHDWRVQAVFGLKI